MPKGNLRLYLNTNPNVDEDLKMTWIKGIAAGMLHISKEGIVHRDLAARNILLSGDLTAKIADCNN